MTLREYIRDQVFAPRADAHGCLVIYDPEKRYREIALALATGKKREVIDISASIIEQREAATQALDRLASGAIHQLILWIPMRRPTEPDQKQKDPFAVFAEIGAAFPSGDGDEFAEICRRAKPDHIPEVNRMFAEGTPSLDMIDALENGVSWPRLKTLLSAQSPKEILLGILSPSNIQEDELREDATWINEAREFSHRSLGHKLVAKGHTRQSVADELWRLLLFSEFVMDSAGEIPEELATVPRAGDHARSLVYEVCEALRKHDDHRDRYKDKAREIEKNLGLANKAQGMRNLGERDTFPFEERIFLDRLVAQAIEGNCDEAREILRTRARSVWRNEEDRLTEWNLADRALNLLDAARRLPEPKFTTLEAIIQAYASIWKELDRNHREMEQAATQVGDEHKGLGTLLDTARKAYFRSVSPLQTEFTRLVQAEGWPVANGQLLWNRQVFDRKVAPLLDAGGKVAYFLVDSLRYELGVELEKIVSETFKVDLVPVCAQLPTYTEIGMASLMPAAESALSLKRQDDGLVTTLDKEPATTPATRFAYMQKRKGDQCMDIDLENLLQKQKKPIPDKVKLLVVRTYDIDATAHANPQQALEIIPKLLRQIIRGLRKVEELGFAKAVIATDHGFILVHDQAAGDLAPKPKGKWLLEKSRCLLGQGKADANNLVLDAKIMGIPGEVEHYATPKTLVPYTRGQLYYHEGLSLQECVIPCLTIQLAAAAAGGGIPLADTLTLSYRQGKTDNKISTRRPILDLSWPGDLFSDEGNVPEFIIEATDRNGKNVGSVAPGPNVNPATGYIRIRPGNAISFCIQMDDEFRGTFAVRVLDSTTNATLHRIELKTAYLE